MKKSTIHDALTSVDAVIEHTVEQARAKAVEVDPLHLESFHKQFLQTREWIQSNLGISVSQDNPEILFLNTQDFIQMVPQLSESQNTKAFVIPGTEVIFIHHNLDLISKNTLRSYLHMANHEYLHLLQKTKHFSQPNNKHSPTSFSLGVSQKNFYFSEESGKFSQKGSGLFLNEMLTESLNLVILQQTHENDEKGTAFVDVGYRLYPLFFMQLIESLGSSPEDAQFLLQQLWKMTFTGDHAAYKNFINMLKEYLQRVYSQEKYSYLLEEGKKAEIQRRVKELFHVELKADRFASGRHFENLLRQWGLEKDKRSEDNKTALFIHLNTNENLPYEQVFLNGMVTIK